MPLKQDRLEQILQELLLEDKVAVSIENGTVVYSLTKKGEKVADKIIKDLGIT